MNAEPTDFHDFLGRHHPFDLLPPDALAEVSGNLTVRDIPRGTVVMTPGEPANTLYIVCFGAVETRSPDGDLLARLGEGECFGVRAILRGGITVNRTETIEDTRLLLMPSEMFVRLRRNHLPFAYHFAAFEGGRFQDAGNVVAETRGSDLLNKRVGNLLIRGPVTVPTDTPIRDAALTMRNERVSCVMITDGGALVGILTDRDLRNRVVAEGLSIDATVERVMTRDPLRISVTDYALDALMLMSRHNIHHVPVMRDGAVTGCLTATSVIESHTASPVFLARNVHNAESPQRVQEAMQRLPGLVHQLTESGATAHSIGHIVSALTDAVTVRLLRLAEESLGPPPVPYAWLAAGSQARQEQTALSDQDNCLLLHDSYHEQEHGAYFKALADAVCHGLNACGYVYCPGGMMAMNLQWRKPLSVWKSCFRRWIEEPEPKALMLSCVFFDLRHVHGDPGLLNELHDFVLEKTKSNRIFQTYMAGNAVSRHPPIGFFRNLVLIHGGEHDRTLDLKHNGVVPIVDIARLYALAAGSPAVNTADRLQAAAAAQALNQKTAVDLMGALEFIGITRLRHQARMAREGKPTDNFLSPVELSGFEKGHLKSAFFVVKTMQAAIASTYQLGRF
ncbi:cyclic nucleotide-binding/CBS domain-containing protein [Azospirillum brasilense]|uniref:Cyclic nucleotide-binding/CBS domain-containing protein n=1 Tax=Azospirillum brasilense TaxID=192 RepID=A0A0P0EDS6_AZOBR|nr:MULTISPECIES: DUF294 nucleotidyltransferase-like domain-containing protein [Azospirillum]ALJ35906.1 hypothetical protein AMK58_11030 [Azospirillum brasilense]MDW7552312.1 DUF294 nucleotidyltransferase-like domain-containing protein [Azospirillum brasilense]MDW7592497.1 DUF294 nucleotidyltransferase-like domain-containing protein [Azospirillum brasilense]MDW7596525.1 DUF294 nucleotidyltransferase-like domain-containing protein [Azospirillum brasilense]MDW7627626.1 DUF294 nucleotidyltransfera